MRIHYIKLLPTESPLSIRLEILSSSDNSNYKSSTTVSSQFSLERAKQVALEDHCRCFARIAVEEAIKRGEI
jgi:hypothetical protein